MGLCCYFATPSSSRDSLRDQKLVSSSSEKVLEMGSFPSLPAVCWVRPLAHSQRGDFGSPSFSVTFEQKAGWEGSKRAVPCGHAWSMHVTLFCSAGGGKSS